MYVIIIIQVGENKKKDKKEDGSVSPNQTTDQSDSTATSDTTMSNGVSVIVKMETEKLDTK